MTILRNIVAAAACLSIAMACVAVNAKAAEKPAKPQQPSLSLVVMPVDSDGIVKVQMHNLTGRTLFLTWNRYSHSQLAGHFTFVVKDSKGALVSATTFDKSVHEPQAKSPNPRPASGAYLRFGPDQNRILRFNIARFASITAPGSYTLQVAYSPDDTHKLPTISSNPVKLDVTSLSNDPALSTTIDWTGQTVQYAEGRQ